MNRDVSDGVFALMTRQDDSRFGRWLHDLISAILVFGPMVIAAAAVAAVVALVQAAASLPWLVWVIVSPVLYLGWLLSFLALNAWLCWAVGSKNPKPRYAVVQPGVQRGSKELLGIATGALCYRRFAGMRSIPLASLLAQLPHFDTLVLRAYSPSVRMGKSVSNKLNVCDPDLTEIGDFVILGGESSIVAHTLVFRGDALAYVSAPITIGSRVTIGAAAHVALGCVIGDDAILEAGSVVEPFSRIPPGEVWGGNPARFRRHRDDIGVAQTTDSVPAAAAESSSASDGAAPRDELRMLVVDALGLGGEEAAGDLSTETCALWDSLGQIAIAAALFDRYGVAVDGPEIFRLRTLDDIAAVVAGGTVTSSPAGAKSAADTREASQSEAESPLPDDIEMLPLLDGQAATRAIAAASFGANGHERRQDIPLRVTIAASFTAQPLEPTLRLWARAFGFDLDCRFAGYDQIVQALLDPSAGPVADANDVAVVLTRPEDLPSDGTDASSALDELLGAVEHAAAVRRAGGRLLVGTLPPVVSSFAALAAGESDALRHRWRSRLAEIDGVEVFDFSRVVETLGVDRARDGALESLTRSAYSQRLHQELAIALVRHIRAAYGPRAKVVALDCDNTIWGGVVGEVGLDGLQLGSDGPGRSFELFQRHLKRLKDRGVLLAVVSRNEEADVRQVFTDHPDMVLRTEDIAAWRVNWRHKSENLVELAEELNLGLDSFVFLDDDPATRMEVKVRAPSVHVVPLPSEPAGFCETLDRLWLFDGLQATAVDATRTQKIQEEAQRRREQGSSVSVEDFLERLELEVDLSRASEQDWPRVAQLTQRTNQFNLSLRRRTLEELKAVAAEAIVLVLRARDRFGDYGQIGACVLRPSGEPGCWELDTFLMSCRALGRGVEDAFLHGVAARAAEAGATSLVAPYAVGPRNGQIKDFLARIGFEETQADVWNLPLASLPPLPAHVRFRTVHSASALKPTDAPTGFFAFREADVALFSAASGDRNPLHLSEEYARKTPYGQRVAFGVLGALAALGHLPDGCDGRIREVEVEFRQPMFIGVRYRVEHERLGDDTDQLSVRDAGRLVLKLRVEREIGGEAEAPPPAAVDVTARREAADLALDEIDVGAGATGSYSPSGPAFEELLNRWELGAKSLGRDRLAALLWSSYLVGMELPGKRALFWSLKLSFGANVAGSEAFSFAAAVERVDTQLEFVDVAGELSGNGVPWAQAKLRAFVRHELPPLTAPASLRTDHTAARNGTVAVVIGGSRGLGAAIVRELAMEGCTVLATYWKSTADAESVARSIASASGSVEFIQGDAGDEAWCRDVLYPRVAAHGRLDLLVCNAAPPLRSLGLHADELERFRVFTAASLALTASPLSVLLERLSDSSGSCVLVSSSALRSPPADWPHYVAAKSAAEGLISWAAAKYPRARFLVARPPRMLTDMTNAPGGRWSSVAPDAVAAAILRRLSSPTGDRVEFLETFDS